MTPEERFEQWWNAGGDCGGPWPYHDRAIAKRAFLSVYAAAQDDQKELVEALEAIIAQWDTPNWKLTEQTGAIINCARAVLAKAKGRKP